MIIGRAEEIKILQNALNSEESEFIAVYGRRRVGKTYLIREAYSEQFAFQHTGVAKANKTTQLSRFYKSLQLYGLKKTATPKDWYEAFDMLEELLDQQQNAKKLVFIDELPWMDTAKSNFVSALEFFWNNWASARHDVVLVVCGSATSWVINKILKNHGGLHNRVTQKIHLKPFNLLECEEYAKWRNLNMSRHEIVEAYMVLGGIPFYWKHLQRGLSTAQNIDQLFFGEGSALESEFESLYASLFNRPESYVNIVETLSKKGIGMSRGELLAATKMTDNKSFDKALVELEECGFIRKYENYKMRRKNALYQLIDNYTLFYFRFLTAGRQRIEHFWTKTINSREQTTWKGLAFERVCLWHVKQIKQSLGISGILTETFSWHVKGNDEHKGAQVDLVIDRDDKMVNLCEMKYSSDMYSIDKDIHQDLINKRLTFLRETKTRKTVHTTMVTTYGVEHNAYWNDVQSEVTMNDLFN
ncbi:MAG: ATP-binding protein [bacterium]|nr:ATP-binding protein [Candidatus Limimorpha caballi]